jgi:indole-3-pyruvate monooxygenase
LLIGTIVGLLISWLAQFIYTLISEAVLRPLGQRDQASPIDAPPDNNNDNKNESTDEIEQVDVLVIGAGPAGLAAAGGIRVGEKWTDEANWCRLVVVEREQAVATSWRRHYSRLHLHTPRMVSQLPGVPMPDHYPQYPSRQQVVDYCQGYASMMQFDIRFNCAVESMQRDAEHDRWTVSTTLRTFSARCVIVCTGENAEPKRPEFDGLDARFEGRVLHSHDYDNGEAFRGSDVLVVGFGNSAGEIAIDLREHGAKSVTMTARSPVNIMPRRLVAFTAPMHRLYRALPLSWVDRITMATLAREVGPVDPALNVQCPRPGPHGPIYQLVHDHKPPVIDIGQLALIRAGTIKVHKAIERFDASSVRFTDGQESAVDVVVLATGFAASMGTFLPRTVLDDVADERGLIKTGFSGRAIASQPGLYFVGYADLYGRILEMNIEAKRVAQSILSERLNQA